MVFGGGGQVGRHLMEMASATGRDLVGLTHEEAARRLGKSRAAISNTLPSTAKCRRVFMVSLRRHVFV